MEKTNYDETIKKFAELGTTEIPTEIEKSNTKPVSDDAKFEIIATQSLQKECRCVLTHARLNINGFVKDFDMVNIDEHIVGDAKNFTWTRSGNNPSAKISILNEYAWLFQSLEKYQKQKWRKIFVMGEETLANSYAKKHAPLLGDIEIYYCSPAGVLTKIR